MLPTQQPLETSVRVQDGQAILDMDGEINGLCEEILQNAYAEIERHGVKSIVLNFSKVIYINSTGIALIVGLLAQARKNHTPVITYGLSDHYLEIFRVTRLADFMAIVPDEQSALARAA
jgi:anti-anti-sigma factor